MSDPFVGEMRVFALNFVPNGWLPCDGRALPVNAYTPLYAVIGNNYGGTTTTFNLPDLRFRALAGKGSLGGSTYQMGQLVGEASHTLVNNETPIHNHVMQKIKTAGGIADKLPAPTAVANLGVLSTGSTSANCLAPQETINTTMAANAIGLYPSQATSAHQNCQPYLALTVAISTEGMFPMRP